MPAIGVEEDTSTLEDLDFEIMCQNEGHNSGEVAYNNGMVFYGHVSPTDTAVWDSSWKCPVCGGTGSAFVCDARREEMTNYEFRDSRMIHATGCQGVSFVREWNYTFTPLKGRKE